MPRAPKTPAEGNESLFMPEDRHGQDLLRDMYSLQAELFFSRHFCKRRNPEVISIYLTTKITVQTLILYTILASFFTSRVRQYEGTTVRCMKNIRFRFRPRTGSKQLRVNGLLPQYLTNELSRCNPSLKQSPQIAQHRKLRVKSLQCNR